MRINTPLALYAVLVGIAAQTVVDGCPKGVYACLDVINSNLCISQNAMRGTREDLINCVTYENSASNLTGAEKVNQLARNNVVCRQ
ncbi:hypothetical protein ONS95_003020 [Cadophora gregata]|uniref:uncharacterized protein n=1 Tax=Cadophora gregata TaxID=51156 RepID=UPI0026DD4E2D|nr:uncharacterized protein ONS95_003020 [Cadophora gregata]KAK0108198.1 hypothetical protein ONS95_003020 [Cadophora gregata]